MAQVCHGRIPVKHSIPIFVAGVWLGLVLLVPGGLGIHVP
jgi:hypothetical protein